MACLLNKYAISSYRTTSSRRIQTTALQVAFSQNIAKPDGDKNMGFSSNEFKTSDIPKGYKAVQMNFDVRSELRSSQEHGRPGRGRDIGARGRYGLAGRDT